MEDRSLPKRLASFGSIRLYYEDLEDLISLMCDNYDKETSEMLVSINNLSDTYQSLDEMRRNAGDDVDYIRLISNSVVVELQKIPRKLRLENASDRASEKHELIFFRVKQFLEEQSNPRKTKTLKAFGTGAGIIALSLGFISGRVYNTLVKEWKLLAVFVALGVYAVVWGYADFYLSYLVTLKRRHEVKSFLNRQRDNLILGFLWAIVGAVLGVVATVLYQGH